MTPTPTPEPTPTGGTVGLLVLAGVLLTAVGGGTGIAALIVAIRQRAKIKVDAAKVVTDAAITLIQPLEQRLERAEQEGASVRAELAAVRNMLHRIVRAILAPDATIDRLRAMIASHNLTEGDHHEP